MQDQFQPGPRGGLATAARPFSFHAESKTTKHTKGTKESKDGDRDLPPETPHRAFVLFVFFVVPFSSAFFSRRSPCSLG